MSPSRKLGASALHLRTWVLGASLLTATASAAAAPPHWGSVGPAASSDASMDGEWYLGARVGYAAGNASTTSSGQGRPTSSYRTMVGGLQLGYMRPVGSRLVVGVETGASVPNFLENDDRVSSAVAGPGRVEEKVDAAGSVRARLGWAFELGTVYGMGGLAWSLGRFVRSDAAGELEEERWHVRPGWTVGAGVTTPVGDGWRARLEYTYDRLARASESFAPGVSTSSIVSTHGVWLGLDWGGGRAAPADPTPALAQSAVIASATESPLTASAPEPGQPLTRLDSGLEASPPDAGAAAPAVWNIHGQTTFVGQGYPGFHSPYEGQSSLSGSAQFRNTVSMTAFLGMRLWPGAELYFNPELMQGFGLSDVHGVAAFPNGEAQKSSFPVPRLNAARLYLTQAVDLGGERVAVEDGPNQLSGERAVSRLTVTAGKLAVTDFFLVNTYAGEPRTRFLNWNIYGGGSYDWTMDLLSWTWGALAELSQPRWSLRAGYFLLPEQASSNHFDTRAPGHGQYVAELEVRGEPFARPGKVQLFGWFSHGNIGSYAEALAQPATTPGYPDVTLTRGRDRSNYGFVLSAEQAVGDELGLFSRVSWSPEEVESMGWTDCGQSLSLGATLGGKRWGRPSDTVGLAGVIEGLSSVTRRYLAAGGAGILVGDGRLTYRPEAVLETYYAYAATTWAVATLDYQLVVNPGYNADRGPVSVFAVRLHGAF